MRFYARALATALLIATFTLGASASGQPSGAPIPPASLSSVIPTPTPDWTQALAALDDLVGVHAVEVAVAGLLADVARLVAAAAPAGLARPRGGGGPHSDLWWTGVANCEQGGENDPWFGYFSWMKGQTQGMTWDEQVAYSNAAIASNGEERMSRGGPWADICIDRGYEYSTSG